MVIAGLVTTTAYDCTKLYKANLHFGLPAIPIFVLKITKSLIYRHYLNQHRDVIFIMVI